MQQAIALTELLLERIAVKDESSNGSNFSLAISGGSSPKELFTLWASEYLDIIPWSRIELFWVDERCVSPLDIESNFRMAKELLLDYVQIPEEQVHRIIGEEDPDQESLRYSRLVMDMLKCENDIPIFDFIILGIGDDGHTSSIFPGQKELFDCKYPYAPSLNPHSGQKRIAMTGLPIMNASMSAYYLFGKSKEPVMDLLSKNKGSTEYPAAYLIENGWDTKIFWDR